MATLPRLKRNSRRQAELLVKRRFSKELVKLNINKYAKIYINKYKLIQANKKHIYTIQKIINL